MQRYVPAALSLLAAVVVLASCFMTWVRVEVDSLTNLAITAAGPSIDLDLPLSLVDAALGGLSAHHLAGYGLLISALAIVAAGCAVAAIGMPTRVVTIGSAIVAGVLVGSVGFAGIVIAMAQGVLGWVMPESWEEHAPSVHIGEGLWIGLVASIVLFGAAAHEAATTWRKPYAAKTRGNTDSSPRVVVPPAGPGTARDVWG